MAPRTARPQVPGVRLERPHWEAGRIVAGLDEVGRGAWAGPVTVGVVVFPPERRVYRLRDSKLLSPARREQLARRISQVATGVGIGHADNHEIDRHGMTVALRLAAHRALDALGLQPDVVLVDGNYDLLRGADVTARRETVIGGDGCCASIAAASVVAKVTRDELMRRLDDEHPAYGFRDNKGYPTPAHRASISSHGPCGLHRRSWSPFAPWRQPTSGLDGLVAAED